ncbi:MAG TPA: UPF0262 family protein [Magnetospirillum sp.]|nr:UPF0262 family protein [Magnetospirillum sp.]
MPHRQRIAHVQLDERTMVRRRPEVEHERNIAIYDLLEENYFAPHGEYVGPYHLRLSLADNRLLFDVRSTEDAPILEVPLALKPFQSIVKDYFLICESYFSAIKKATPSQIEAIDMGRRGLHNEGSELLKERLAARVDVDFDTARRLFTLVCVLHLRG